MTLNLAANIIAAKESATMRAKLVIDLLKNMIYDAIDNFIATFLSHHPIHMKRLLMVKQDARCNLLLDPSHAPDTFEAFYKTTYE